MANLDLKKIPWRKVSIALAVIFILIQFFRIDKTNPTVVAENDFLQIVQPSAEIADMLTAACYDCHSNETQYPWYMDVAPVSWWAKGHIDNGRESLNFSVWGTYDGKKSNHKLEECAEEVELKKMPLTPYWIMHPEAKLSEEQRAELAAFFRGKMD